METQDVTGRFLPERGQQTPDVEVDATTSLVCSSALYFTVSRINWAPCDTEFGCLDVWPDSENPWYRGLAISCATRENTLDKAELLRTTLSVRDVSELEISYLIRPRATCFLFSIP